MIDCKSFVNSGQIRCKPRGFNCAGLLDEYRRPKLAFDTVKRLFRYYSEPDNRLRLSTPFRRGLLKKYRFFFRRLLTFRLF